MLADGRRCPPSKNAQILGPYAMERDAGPVQPTNLAGSPGHTDRTSSSRPSTRTRRLSAPKHPDTLTARGSTGPRLPVRRAGPPRPSRCSRRTCRLYEECARSRSRGHAAIPQRSRGQLPGDGPSADAVALHEQNLSIQERLHGIRPPRHHGHPVQPRQCAVGRRPHRRGTGGVPADPGRPGTGARPRARRRDAYPWQPGQRLPGRRANSGIDRHARTEPGHQGARARRGRPRHHLLAPWTGESVCRSRTARRRGAAATAGGHRARTSPRRRPPGHPGVPRRPGRQSTPLPAGFPRPSRFSRPRSPTPNGC